MSTVVTNKVQIGQSVDPLKNFTLRQPNTPDGSLVLSRGNADNPGATILTVNAQGAIMLPDGSMVGGNAWRRRIDNGDMRIDQRNNGAAVTATTSPWVYPVDRMFIVPTGANVTAQRVAGTGAYANDLLITGAAGNTEVQLRHRIESVNCADLKNKDVTCQIQLARSVAQDITWYAYSANAADNWGASTLVASGVINAPTASTIRTFQFNAGANAQNGLMLIVSFGALGAGQTMRVSGFQLEPGNVATLFEWRDYGDELRRCQRYYEKVVFQNVLGSVYASGYCATAQAQFKATKRTASYSATISNLSATNLTAIGYAGNAYPSLDGCAFVFTTTSAVGASGALVFDAVFANEL